MLISVLRLVLAFVLYLGFQVMLLHKLELWNIASPFVFILYLFMLPLSVPTTALYLIAFSMGLMVDWLSDSYIGGLHAFSALLAVASRRYVLQLTLPSSFREANEVSWADQSNVWFALYIGPLIFIHHFSYFMLEAFSFHDFFGTLLKIIASSIYTFIISYSLCIIFYKRK